MKLAILYRSLSGERRISPLLPFGATRSARAAARLAEGQDAARRCGIRVERSIRRTADGAGLLARLAGSLGARPPRRGGVDPRGTGRDADRAAPRSDGGAATYAARTTNIIENLNGSVERYTRNV